LRLRRLRNSIEVWIVVTVVSLGSAIMATVRFATDSTLPLLFRFLIPGAIWIAAIAIPLVFMVPKGIRSWAHQLNLTLFGLGYSDLKVICEVQDDGSAIVTRRATLVARSHVRELPMHLRAPESEATGEADPPSIKITRSSGYKTRTLRAIPEKAVWTLTSRKTPIAIEPELEPGEEIEFEMVEKGPPRVFRTRSCQKESKTEHDYFFWDIVIPTARFAMRVQLPEGTRALRSSVSVYYSLGPPTQLNRNEMREIESRLEVNDNKDNLTLHIDHPLLAMAYKVEWDPVFYT